MIINPSPAVDGYIRENAKKYIFDENDMDR